MWRSASQALVSARYSRNARSPLMRPRLGWCTSGSPANDSTIASNCPVTTPSKYGTVMNRRWRFSSSCSRAGAVNSSGSHGTWQASHTALVEYVSGVTTGLIRAVSAVVAGSLAILAPAAAANPTSTPLSWRYVNPLRQVGNLEPSRIDMGVDYSGAGPILALGRAKVVLAPDKLAGPESCWGKTCVPPPGDMIVYRLLDGPFAGKYVYVVEHITIGVKAGETVRAGKRIATLHQGSPNLEMGWASGHGAQTLAVARGHQGRGIDPGGWSSIEGRNFNSLLVWLG